VLRKRRGRPAFEVAALALLLACLPSFAAGPAPQVISRAELAKLKQKPCALFHVWATWCMPCIDELPKFLKLVAAYPKVTPVVLDISAPYVQDNFSKKWLAQLAPPFVTYLKPEGDDKAYLSVLENPWPNRLPYNALFVKGKRTGRWMGTQDPAQLGKELTRLCQ
jgi:thiol-disulfide isomerase/thioredoxin